MPVMLVRPRQKKVAIQAHRAAQIIQRQPEQRLIITPLVQRLSQIAPFR